jgi:hypothetical protein
MMNTMPRDSPKMKAAMAMRMNAGIVNVIMPPVYYR